MSRPSPLEHLPRLLAEKDDEIGRLRELLVAESAKAVDLAHALAIAEGQAQRSDEELRKGSDLLSRRIREIGDAVYQGRAAEAADDLYAIADELKAPRMIPIPPGAVEWLERQYAACGQVEVVARARFGTETHVITELECKVNGGTTLFVVAEDVADIHPQGAIASAPMTYGEVAHLLANVTARELVEIGRRVDRSGSPMCPRAVQPHPDGEPIGYPAAPTNWPEIERRAHEVIVQWAIGESLKDPPAAEGLSDAIEALKESMPRDAFQAEAERTVEQRSKPAPAWKLRPGFGYVREGMVVDSIKETWDVYDRERA